MLSLSGKEVTARLKAETRAAAGESMDFAFNMEKASYFDVDEKNVQSPTYAVVHEYSGKIPLYHFRPLIGNSRKSSVS